MRVIQASTVSEIVTMIVVTCMIQIPSLAAKTHRVDPNPEVALEMLKGVQNEMVARISGRNEILSTADVRDLVDSILVPHVNFEIASEIVLSNHWKSASIPQRAEFVQEFRAFLVRFYSAVLSSYTHSGADVSDNLMTFSDDIQRKGTNQLIVKSFVKPARGESIPVMYRMLHTDSIWKVVDVSVAGVSLAKSYRSSFVSMVRQDGIDILIENLRAKNAQFDQQ